MGILRCGRGEVPDVEMIFNDEASVRRLIDRFPEPGQLRVCYEAGPIGFGLHRLLTSMGVACEVIAPSLIPKAPGDRVKTDRRDCKRLARLHRAGELVAIRVPTPAEEAVRDLCRARADLVDDRTRTRHRLSKFLLRHDRIWRGGEAWTGKHEQWLAGQRFDEPALRATYGHYRAVLVARDAELAAIEADLAHWYHPRPVRRRGDPAGRLPRDRPPGRVDDRQRGRRLAPVPHRRAFMGFTGLVPSEYSSGESVHRGHITKAGNAHLRTQLVESAWAYQHRPSLGVVLRRRQDGVDPATAARSWTAQQRLCGRFRRLDRPQEQPQRRHRRHRPRARRVPVGRNDRRLTESLTPMNSRADDTPVGSVTARAANPTTRRGTPWQDRSPSDLWPTATAATAAPSQGHHPAHTRHAISTREHQKGGAPTRSAPTRRGHTPRPPPRPDPRPSLPCPAARSSAPGQRLKGASGVARRYADLDPPTRPRLRAAIGAGKTTRAQNRQPTTTRTPTQCRTHT